MSDRTGYNVEYDEAGEVQVIEGAPREVGAPELDAPETLGCHSGGEMENAARLAGASEIGCVVWQLFSADRPAAFTG